MENKFRIYQLNDDVSMQMVSYTPELMTARFWFSGKGFDGTHHHANQEVNIVISGEFEATNGEQKFKVGPGHAVTVASDVDHNMECLTGKGEMISTWTPVRQDLLKYTELA